MTIALLFAVLSFLAVVIYLCIFVALHILPTGYNPIHHAVSDYGVGKYSSLFRVAIWVNAAGWLILAFALASGVGVPPLATIDLVFLGLVTLTRIGLSLFPTDLEGSRLTRTGILHYVFAIASFALVFIVVLDITPVLQTLEPWRQISGVFTALYWVILVSLILVNVCLIPRFRSLLGLVERVYLLSTNIWFLLVSGLLIVKLISR